jgi:hypothetical protein
MTKFYLLSVTALTFLGACSFGGSHERFVHILSMNVGSKLRDFEFMRATAPLNILKLENGNVEYRYPYSTKSCVTVYEVDPETDVIKRFSFEGDKKDCVWM